MDVTFSLCLPRDAASVSVVRHLCRCSMQNLGVMDGCVGDVELAVTEACTNVLKHARGTEEEYNVEITLDHELCEIRVKDTGRGFDHGALTETAVQASAEGGRGLLLMRALVDRVDFASQPEHGTIVHLVKTLKLRDGSVLRRLGVTPSGAAGVGAEGPRRG